MAAVGADGCGYCGKPLPQRATGRRARYCDGRCRTAAYRERNEAAAAAARLRTLKADLLKARDALVDAVDRVVDAAQRDDGTEAGTLLLDLVQARSALADLSAAATELRDDRLLVARYERGNIGAPARLSSPGIDGPV